MKTLVGICVTSFLVSAAPPVLAQADPTLGFDDMVPESEDTLFEKKDQAHEQETPLPEEEMIPDEESIPDEEEPAHEQETPTPEEEMTPEEKTMPEETPVLEEEQESEEAPLYSDDD